MATFTEAMVKAGLEVRRDPAGNVRVFAEGRSFTAAGQAVRSVSADITDQLSFARQQGVADLLADVEAKLRQQFSIE